MSFYIPGIGESTNLLELLGTKAAASLAAPAAKALQGKSIAPQGSDALLEIADAAAMRERRKAKAEQRRTGKLGGEARAEAKATRLAKFRDAVEAEMTNSNASLTAAVTRAKKIVGISMRTAWTYADDLGLTAKKSEK